MWLFYVSQHKSLVASPPMCLNGPFHSDLPTQRFMSRADRVGCGTPTPQPPTEAQGKSTPPTCPLPGACSPAAIPVFMRGAGGGQPPILISPFICKMSDATNFLFIADDPDRPLPGTMSSLILIFSFCLVHASDRWRKRQAKLLGSDGGRFWAFLSTKEKCLNRRKQRVPVFISECDCTCVGTGEEFGFFHLTQFIMPPKVKALHKNWMKSWAMCSVFSLLFIVALTLVATPPHTPLHTHPSLGISGCCCCRHNGGIDSGDPTRSVLVSLFMAEQDVFSSDARWIPVQCLYRQRQADVSVKSSAGPRRKINLSHICWLYFALIRFCFFVS